jgi:uncharacterized protein YbjT (DUF2867 family)
VKSSGAKRAFVYLSHTSKDNMRATIEALKSSGIDFVVFLSGFSTSDPPSGPQSDHISQVHASVEVALQDVFGDNFVAARPGVFATNVLRHSKGIADGTVALYGPEMLEDFVTPGDIGTVAGTLLVKGPQNGQKAVYIHGPQIMSTQQGIETIGKVIGKDIKIQTLTAEQAIEGMGFGGIPRPIAESLVDGTKKAIDSGDFVGRSSYDEGVENVRRYKGAEGESFEQWVKSNQFLFTG